MIPRLLLISMLLIAACTGGRGPGDGPLTVGSPAPDFELPTLEGGTLRLSSLRGKVVFINFWATWCAPCRDEMPSMERLYGQLGDDGFAMLAVSVDEGGEEEVLRFLEDIPHSYPILLDATQGRRLSARTGEAYGITGVPETFVIDRRGYIVEKVVGPTDWDDPTMVEYFQGLITGAS
jgi:peroxiredoxin